MRSACDSKVVASVGAPAASRSGDFDQLLALLDPEVVLRADDAAVRTGAERRVVGPRPSHRHSPVVPGGRAGTDRQRAGLVWSMGGQPRVVFDFTIVAGLITGIGLLAEAEDLALLDVQPLDDL